MPPISVLMKPSSGMCNMKCDYCFYCDETQKRIQESYGFMSEQTLKNVIRKTMLRAEGAVSYAFQGGEPTLRGIDFFEKVVEFEKQYNKHGIRVNNALQTNGYLINEAWCEFFQKNHFLIGLSVDGTKEIHDSYRHTKDGKPTFDRIRHAAELMSHYGVDSACVCHLCWSTFWQSVYLKVLEWEKQHLFLQSCERLSLRYLRS